MVEAQNYQIVDHTPNTFTCYSDYTSYSNDINSYPNFVATMYTGTGYTGYRLAIVSYHGCLDGGVNYDKYVSDLAGSGFRDNIASSKVYGSNCTGGYAFDNAYYTCPLNINYGYHQQRRIRSGLGSRERQGGFPIHCGPRDLHGWVSLIAVDHGPEGASAFAIGEEPFEELLQAEVMLLHRCRGDGAACHARRSRRWARMAST